MRRDGKPQTLRRVRRIMSELRPWRWRLSTLLLTMGLVAVWIQAGLIGRQNVLLRKDIAVMRVLAAELEIENPEEYAVVREQTRWHDENIWRVYLPPGHRHHIHLATREIESEGLPAPTQSAMLLDGERRIEYRKERQEDQFWKISVFVDDEPVIEFREDGDWETSFSYVVVAGISRSTQMSIDQPLVLHRLRFQDMGKQARTSTPPERRANGILIWITNND